MESATAVLLRCGDDRLAQRFEFADGSGPAQTGLDELLAFGLERLYPC